MKTLSCWCVVAMALGSMACSSSAAVKAAERGDYTALRQILADDMKNGRLDGGEARAVAEAVVQREVSSSKGADGVARVRELRPCAAQTEEILEDRVKQRDEAAPVAAMLLLDDHLVSADKWSEQADSPDPGWRAVGARSLVDVSHGARRRELISDLFVDVRRAAIRASYDASDSADQGTLLEVVRVDPDQEARVLAARGVGAIGGEGGVRALKDRWFDNNESVRLAIVRAWGDPSSYGAGGNDQLFWVAESDKGAASLVAATRLLRQPPGHDAYIGRAAMLRALSEGPASVRQMAINLADLQDEAQRQEIVKASESEEGPVRVAALVRLTEVPEQRARALEALGTIAATEGPQRNAARSGLARARDRRVVQLLTEDTRAAEPGVRAWAAAELASMKEFPPAAQPLADEDPSVRTRVACSILAMPR